MQSSAQLFPKAGGEFEYTKKAFGKNVGIITGGIISMNGIISGATVSVGFAGYFTRLLTLPGIFVAIGIALIFLSIFQASGNPPRSICLHYWSQHAPRLRH